MEEDLLKYAADNGMIDISYLRQQIEMNKRRCYLEKHDHKVWKGQDGRWRTYFRNGDGKLKLVTRSTEEKIYDLIVEHYKEEEVNPTVEDIFKDWISKKYERGDIQLNTKQRYERQFEQCFVEFGKRRIQYIKESDIEDFILDTIAEQNLTVKGYGNFRTLVYGVFKRAKKLGYIDYSITNTIGDIEISRKAFRRIRHTDDELIFMENELPAVKSLLEDNLDMLNLGLLLLFATGMRVGELSSLRPCDIEGNIVHVNSTEIRYVGEDGKAVYEVRNFPKTEAGIRDIVMKKEDVWITKRIRALNPFGKYLFEKNGKRIRSYNFRNRLTTICKNANITQKSPNKIRKTYGTIMLDAGISESTIINQMGHTNISTTKNHYYRNRKDISKREEELSNVSFL